MPDWKDRLDPAARGGRFLPWKEVARATGLSRTTAWRLQKRGEFPAPYAISPGRVGYREDEVEAWRVSRDPSAARRSPPAGVGPAPQRAAASITRSRPATHPDAAASEASRPSTPPPPAIPKPAQAERRPGTFAPRRRRSQHAQAIAQQMLFDF